MIDGGLCIRGVQRKQRKNSNPSDQSAEAIEYLDIPFAATRPKS
jgi:hypothetical protein